MTGTNRKNQLESVSSGRVPSLPEKFGFSELGWKLFRSGANSTEDSKECCCLPLRLPKSYFRYNRRYCYVHHPCTDESVIRY